MLTQNLTGDFDMNLESKIIEHRPANDIAEVNAWLVEPYMKPGYADLTRVDNFSEFNGDFNKHNVREFIAKVEAENPGKYSQYVISYWSAN